MKKYFLAILIGISLLLMQANISFASTLYSNTLTGDFWNNFYAPCSTSNNGLTCPIDQSENQAGIGINTTQFSNMACVSGDFTSNGGPNQLFIFDQPTDLNSYVVMYIQSGNNLQMNSNINSVVDSGVPSPTWGIHTYMLCKSSDTYTSYVDGSLVQTQIYSSHTGGYAGFQAANGEYFTNFAVKDALPNNNPNIIYSNPMTSNFWNTFFNPCNTPTSSGITCNATSAMNTTQLSSNKCVTFDADSSTGSPQILLGEDPYLINLFAIDFNDNTTINIKDVENNDHDTGISVPSGAHNYGVCQDTNQLTVYIDSSPVYIYTATTFPHLDYFGFTLFPGTHLTNLKVTDTIPQKQLTALDPATVWVKTNFPSLVLNLDLKAEVYKDSTLITSGQINSVGPGTTTTAETIPFNTFSSVDFPSGSTLKVIVYARNACSGSLLNSGTATLSYNNSSVDSNFGATIDGTDKTYHLLDGFVLGTSSGSSTKTVAVSAGNQCSPFKPFGTWTVTL